VHRTLTALPRLAEVQRAQHLLFAKHIAIADGAETLFRDSRLEQMHAHQAVAATTP